jgi:hypothetical protein
MAEVQRLRLAGGSLGGQSGPRRLHRTDDRSGPRDLRRRRQGYPRGGRGDVRRRSRCDRDPPRRRGYPTAPTPSSTARPGTSPTPRRCREQVLAFIGLTPAGRTGLRAAAAPRGRPCCAARKAPRRQVGHRGRRSAPSIRSARTGSRRGDDRGAAPDSAPSARVAGRGHGRGLGKDGRDRS